MLWIKSAHIISMVSWFAGIFYLPRLFVYHSLSEDEISIERFKVMEHKLYYGIMTPSAIATILFGFWLLSYGFWGNWMVAKLVLVGIMIIYHIWCGLTVRRFKNDQNTRSHTFFRVMNELPVFALAAMVVLVVVKPF